MRVTLKLCCGLKNLLTKLCVGRNDFLSGATLLHLYHSAVGTFFDCYCILFVYFK